MEYIREDKFVKPRTPAEVLKLALLKEKASFDFYGQLIKENKDPAIERLLRQLKDAEDGHIQKIQEILNK